MTHIDSRAGPGVAAGVTEGMIHDVVHAFYGKIRVDPALGPIFNRVIGAIGVVSSALVGGVIVASATNMSMTSLLSVLLAQLLWNIAAAVVLIREPSRV